jgi:hypothetical protein
MSLAKEQQQNQKKKKKKNEEKGSHAKRVASFSNSSEDSFTSFSATGVPSPSIKAKDHYQQLKK